MNIVLLNQPFYPDVVATAQYAADLASGLAASGHSVTVIASRRGYDDPRITFGRNELWRGVAILRCFSTGFGKQTFIRRAIDFASFLTSCSVKLLMLPRPDLIIALTSPPLLPALGAAAAKIKRCRFVFWVMDLNPDQAVAAGLLKHGSWTTRALEILLKFSLQTSDSIIALDAFMAERLESKGVPAHKISVLPLWARDEAVFYDIEGRASFRRKHSLEDTFVVMYSGNHSPCHPLDTVLEAARFLRSRSDIVFCFVGGGTEFNKIERFIARNQLSHVRCIPYQPNNQLAASLSAADLHVVTMGSGYRGIVHPCKVYNIRKLGIPYVYIGPSPSHVTQLDPAGSFQHGDAAGVSDFISRMAAKPYRSVPFDIESYSHHTLLNKLMNVAGCAPETSLAASNAG